MRVDLDGPYFPRPIPMHWFPKLLITGIVGILFAFLLGVLFGYYQIG